MNTAWSCARKSLREQHGKPGVLAGTFTLAP